MKKVPVLFVIFSREEVSLKSVASIKKYRPDKLYIAADGPRENKPGEIELCENTRRSVLNAIDWDCETITLFQEKNLGCTQAVSGAISWFFSNEEYGIIIEDDCIIHPDFYTLCESMLPHYKDEEKVMLITAQNHTPDLKHADRLVFTNGCYIWGWASWQRAWEKMDMGMTKWPEYRFGELVKNFGFLFACYLYFFWNKDYRDAKHGSWDTRWFFSVLANKGLCLTSNVNLSINAGIEIGGEHYKKGDVNPYKHLSFGSIKWPVKLPDRLRPSKKKMRAERREFIRIRMIGLRKKIRRNRYVNDPA